MSVSSSALTLSLDVSASAQGPLSGARFVVKENIDVDGLVSTNGHPTFAATHAPAAIDAPVVDRLLAAGARLVGKAHMDEMAYSLLGANAHYGTPINPAAPDRHPGGSSSGSAVAVAAGLADFALGTDTAGSCRAPAAFCGIYGFRPSHGAISSNGVVPLARSLDIDRLVRARYRYAGAGRRRAAAATISRRARSTSAVVLQRSFRAMRRRDERGHGSRRARRIVAHGFRSSESVARRRVLGRVAASFPQSPGLRGLERAGRLDRGGQAALRSGRSRALRLCAPR